MMNDTTTPLHITMHEPEQTREQLNRDNELVLAQTILAAIDGHIERLVERRFNQLVANTKALSLMDEGLREYITEQIDDRISAHETAYDHNDFTTADHVSSQINDEVDDHIRHYLNHADHDLVTKNELHELVRDTLDEQLDEAIERKLDNATISISL